MIVFLVLLGVSLGQIETNIYVPSLPSVGSYFATSNELVKLSLSINLIGIGISSLLYGILSDCYGRKKIYLFGLTTFTIASIICYFNTNIYYFIFARLIQGLGIGVTLVVGQATLKDLYSGVRCAQILSRGGTVSLLSLIISPMIGSFIASYFDWQVTFLVLILIACFLLIMICFFFKETLDITKREDFQISKIFTSYNVIFTNKTFLMICSMQGFIFVWVWNEIAHLPFLFIHIMNMQVEHYSYFVSVIAIIYIIGNLINHRCLPRFGIENMIMIGIIMCIIPDCILLIMQMFITINPYIIIPFWFFSIIGSSFVIANGVSLALSAVPEKSVARASACISFSRGIFISLGIYTSSLLFTVNDLVSIFFTNVFYSCIAFVIYYFYIKRRIHIENINSYIKDMKTL